MVRVEKRQQPDREIQTAAANVEDVVTALETVAAKEIELPGARLLPRASHLHAMRRPIERGFIVLFRRTRVTTGSRASRSIVERQPAFDVAVEDQLSLIEHAHAAADRANGRRRVRDEDDRLALLHEPA